MNRFFLDRVSSGLKKQSIKKVSEWAENYRIMGPPFPGPCKFDHHPWTREMCDCLAETIVGKKAAQMGFTEVALNKVFAYIDMEAGSVLYVLPAKTPDATDFSTSRFDPALEASVHLKSLFTDVKNIGHKRAGHSNLYIRGSRSRSQLKSIPAGLLVFDEVQEMVQANIQLAFERSSGQLKKQKLLISTPSIAGIGIDEYFKDSTQDHFNFKCPACGKFIELIFPECMVITADDPNDVKIKGSHLICSECKKKLVHEDKIIWEKDGVWVPTYADRMTRGFHINQMYSMTMPPYEIAQLYLESLSNPVKEQEFHNSKMGNDHEVKGARVLEEHIINAMKRGGHANGTTSTGLITMGVDVGKWLHYEIASWELRPTKDLGDISSYVIPTVLEMGKVLSFNELDEIWKKHGVSFAVVDADPEGRKTFEWAQKHAGRVKRCRYTRGITGKHMRTDKEEHLIQADRTSWLDVSLGRFKNGTIALPFDTPLEYKSHVRALVRIYKEDTDGNTISKYVKKDNDHDHHAHARNYCEMAVIFAASFSRSQDIGGIM